MASSKVIIITGSKGEGKTTKLQELVKLIKESGISINGIIAEALIINNKRNTYSLLDIESNNSYILCSSNTIKNAIKIGNFFFNKDAIKFGNQIIMSDRDDKNILVIDEIGPFELKDKVWHNSLNTQLNHTNNLIIITVRNSLIKEVIQKYNIKNPKIFSVGENTENIINEILTYVNS